MIVFLDNMQKVGRAATSLNRRDASSDLSETLDVE